MATKKVTRKRKTAAKRKSTTKRKTAAKRKSTTKRKTAAKRKSATKRKTAAKRKSTTKRKTAAKRKKRKTITDVKTGSKNTAARDRKKLRDGFNTKFLPKRTVSLPKFGASIKDDIFYKGEKHVWDYINYSLVMSKSKRQAIYSICNLNTKPLKKGKGRNWFPDRRIGPLQLSKEYYYTDSRGEWQRGHLTKRAATAWGKDEISANEASDDTCSYTNASPQHENFNEDEWKALEDYVFNHLAGAKKRARRGAKKIPARAKKEPRRAEEGRASIITGPVFLEDYAFHLKHMKDYCVPDKTIYTPPMQYNGTFPPRTLLQKGKKQKGKKGGKPVSIPSGFWKIIYYINKKGTGKKAKLTPECQAFLIWQDDLSMSKKKQVTSKEVAVYQVSTNTISKLTGLRFMPVLYDANPLYYSATRARDIKEPEHYLTKFSGKSKNMKEGWKMHIIHDRKDIKKHKFERTSR